VQRGIIEKMIILGIDPGFGRCGWAILKSDGQKVTSENYGCIETSPKLSIEQRIEQVFSEVSKIIKTYRPEALSIEELFFSSNAKTAFSVGQARGVILLAAAQNKLKIAIYTPLQVKMAITGYGRAEKAQIEQMVKILLKLKEIPKPDDVSDALAIAITHAFSAKLAKYTK
jgi:crossover junction endodeoxyribonuclease RuvC